MSIKVNNVSFTYMSKTPNAYQALKGISLNIENNSFTAIVGHTGSGKSTLIQMFNALLKPSEGFVDVDGAILDEKTKLKNVKALRKHVGLVFQFPEYQLFEETVEKDVAFGPRNFGASKEESVQKAHDILLKLGLDETYFTRSPFDLSGGERRKIALAGILAIDPDILILDEPTAGLDPKSAKDIMNLIKELHNNGKTIIVVTHDMDVVFKYCDHVVVLNDGKIAFDGTPNDLFDNLKDDYNIEVPKMVEFLNYLKNHGVSIPKEMTKTTKDIVNYLAKVRGKKHE